MSGPITAVDVVIPEHLPRHFRREEIHLVGRLGAAEDAGRGTPVFVEVSTEAFGGFVEGLIPRRWPKDAGVADEGLSQAGVRAGGCPGGVVAGLHSWCISKTGMVLGGCIGDATTASGLPTVPTFCSCQNSA